MAQKETAARGRERRGGQHQPVERSDDIVAALRHPRADRVPHQPAARLRVREGADRADRPPQGRLAAGGPEGAGRQRHRRLRGGRHRPGVRSRSTTTASRSQDNGPGIPAERRGLLDFSVRVSSARPTSARPAAPRATPSRPSSPCRSCWTASAAAIEIEARGLRHRSTSAWTASGRSRRSATGPSPARSRTALGSRSAGPISARLNPRRDATPPFLQIAADYTWLNPHLPRRPLARRQRRSAVAQRRHDPGWSKWRPSDPTCPTGTTPSSFERLIAAYIAHDADRGREPHRARVGRRVPRPERHRQAEGRARRDRLARAPLTALVNGDDIDHGAVAALLAAMQAQCKPVKPSCLASSAATPRGPVRRLRLRDGELRLPRVMGTTTACRGSSRPRSAGARSATSGGSSPASTGRPASSTRSASSAASARASTRPGQQRAGRTSRSSWSCTWPARASSTPTAASRRWWSSMKADKIIGAVQGVTKKWAKQRKREERARGREREPALRHDPARSIVTIRDAACAIMEEAYLKASANGTLPALARQIMYAARPQIQDYSRPRARLRSSTSTSPRRFCPTTWRRSAVVADWNVVFDARGNFTEPHTGKRVPLGTTGRPRLPGRIAAHEVEDPDSRSARSSYPTMGPRAPLRRDPVHREGGLHAAVRGGATSPSATTSRSCPPRACASPPPASWSSRCAASDVPLLVLHDFDKSGFSIVGTLRRNTRRLPLRQRPRRPSDRPRPAARGHRRPRDRRRLLRGPRTRLRTNLRQNGATPEEIEFLLEQRVELNAFASDELVAWIEGKLAEHGVAKVVPDERDARRRLPADAPAGAGPGADQRVPRRAGAGRRDCGPRSPRPADPQDDQADPLRPWDEALRLLCT